MLKFHLSLDSMILLRPVQVEIYLPGGIADFGSVPVVYCLHPALTDGTFFANQLGFLNLIDKYSFIAVAPSLGNSYYLNQAGGAYFDFLHLELRPLLERTFRINAGSERNFVLGISMGAFGALNWALTGRDRFARAVLVSGYYRYNPTEERQYSRRFSMLYRLIKPFYHLSVEGEPDGSPYDLQAVLEAGLERRAETAFRLYFGKADVAAKLQGTYLQQELQQRGYQSELLPREGEHDAACWGALLPEALQWLFAGLNLPLSGRKN